MYAHYPELLAELEEQSSPLGVGKGSGCQATGSEGDSTQRNSELENPPVEDPTQRWRSTCLPPELLSQMGTRRACSLCEKSHLWAKSLWRSRSQAAYTTVRSVRAVQTDRVFSKGNHCLIGPSDLLNTEQTNLQRRKIVTKVIQRGVSPV